MAGGTAGDRIRLGEAESGHARALRLSPGDPLGLTDGRGRTWRCRLEAVGGGAVCVLQEPVGHPPRLPVRLGFAVAQKERTLWLVEKAVELGAATLEPVEFARSRSVADAARSDAFWRKAERRAVAALKQCGGGWLPEIRPVVPLEQFLRGAGDDPRVVAAGAAERRAVQVLADWDGDARVTSLVGPEGGIEPDELGLCRDAGFAPVSLGPRTLRFETAAVALLAIVAQRAGGPESPRSGEAPPGAERRDDGERGETHG